MNAEPIFSYLRDLSAHNNREWFNANRSRYEAVRQRFEELVQQVIARIATFDESVTHLQPRDCTYRIYRDTRFSPDKTPYKDHLGAYINPRGKNAQHCGYYLHLQPDASLLAGGSWCPPPPLLRALRQAVLDNLDEYRSIVEDPAFTRYYPLVGETFLKTAPKGFPKDHPYLRYIQCKEYTVQCPIDDSLFSQPDFLDHVEQAFRQLKRFSDFVNYTIDDFEDDLY